MQITTRDGVTEFFNRADAEAALENMADDVERVVSQYSRETWAIFEHDPSDWHPSRWSAVLVN